VTDINYKPEGSVGHSISSFVGGIWNEIASTPGNIVQHFKDHTLAAICETVLPPLLIIDADVRAYDNVNAPLSNNENAVKNMVEDSILKGNTTQLHDLMVMHSGDPTALDRIMTQATLDLAQYGVTANWQDAGGTGNLHISTGKHFMNVDTTGTETFGDIKGTTETPASKGANADSYMRSISADAQQYSQQRFQR
jgi:hypothetical protein